MIRIFGEKIVGLISGLDDSIREDGERKTRPPRRTSACIHCTRCAQDGFSAGWENSRRAGGCERGENRITAAPGEIRIQSDSVARARRRTIITSSELSPQSLDAEISVNFHVDHTESGGSTRHRSHLFPLDTTRARARYATEARAKCIRIPREVGYDPWNRDDHSNYRGGKEKRPHACAATLRGSELSRIFRSESRIHLRVVENVFHRDKRIRRPVLRSRLLSTPVSQLSLSYFSLPPYSRGRNELLIRASAGGGIRGRISERINLIVLILSR